MVADGKFETGSSGGRTLSPWLWLFCVPGLVALPCEYAQSETATPPAGSPQETVASEVRADSPDARVELQTGTNLTRQGLFQQAIPHLLAAQRDGSDTYATAVNLGICYVGLTRYKEAIAALTNLESAGFKTAVVENLLTQAYLGDGQVKAAWAAFQSAAALTPKDEKLYAFVADASTDHHDYEMGLQVTEAGLRQLPDSARLHYEHALFLARLDRIEEAKPEFDQAVKLAPGGYIASLAKVQRLMYDDDFAAATRLLRDVVHAGHRDYQTLSLLGTVLLHAGAAPGEPDFIEAQSVLEESATQHPNYSATQIALGELYDTEGHFEEARNHLEIARRLEAANPAVYSHLAHVYRKLGDPDKAHAMEEQLARLLRERKSAPSVTGP
jgi:tetratricopeptide (TPR) repeat protein